MLQAPVCFAPSLHLCSDRHSLHPERELSFHTSKEFLLFHCKKVIMSSRKIYFFLIGSNCFTLPAGLSNKGQGCGRKLQAETCLRNKHYLGRSSTEPQGTQKAAAGKCCPRKAVTPSPRLCSQKDVSHILRLQARDTAPLPWHPSSTAWNWQELSPPELQWLISRSSRSYRILFGVAGRGQSCVRSQTPCAREQPQ